VADFLAGVQLNTDFYKLVAEKKLVLQGLVQDVESETGTSYPRIYLHYPMITEGHGFNRGTTFEMETKKGKIETVVFISGFTLLEFDENIVLGVLVEEFLHFAHRSREVIQGRPIRDLADAVMQEPLSAWFTKSKFKGAYQSAQVPPLREEYEVKLANWKAKGFPEKPAKSLPQHHMIGRPVNFEIPPDFVVALKKRGRL
jgi:hypothetical protein